MATSTEQTPAPQISEIRAKQGRWGKPIVWVLAISTILAAVGLFAAWGLKSDDMAATEPLSRADAVDARKFDAPEPAAVIPQPETAQSTHER